MARSRATRIEAKLPTNLWPELFKTAVYTTNRTPTKQLGWLTPLEVLHRATNRSNPQPSGAHLYILGSRVYGKIQHIPKKEKVMPRSLIGYLVGYVLQISSESGFHKRNEYYALETSKSMKRSVMTLINPISKIYCMNQFQANV
jgi:hypothetical protein